jgi:hypothetical protein
MFLIPFENNCANREEQREKQRHETLQRCFDSRREVTCKQVKLVADKVRESSYLP